MNQTLILSTINDNPSDFKTLFNIWNEYKDTRNLQIDFSNCRFLRQNAVAFLGGMIYNIQSRGGKVSINYNSMASDILMNLAQNGFLSAIGEDVLSWEGNSIPFRHDKSYSPDSITRYLRDQWLGRGWVYVSDTLADTIIGTVWEIYANAFEHSCSSQGVFSCGQYYPNLKKLSLSVVDFGIGIPQSVRRYLDPREYPDLISSVDALEMAFQSGFTTKPKDSRGLGLQFLKEFIQLFEGKMDVYSHEAHGIVLSGHEKYYERRAFFEGTIVNITLKCDEKWLLYARR